MGRPSLKEEEGEPAAGSLVQKPLQQYMVDYHQVFKANFFILLFVSFSFIIWVARLDEGFHVRSRCTSVGIETGQG